MKIFIKKFFRYMNNRGWFLCKVYYDPPYSGGREQLKWKDC